MKEFNTDFDRSKRLGFPEVVFGATKSSNQLVDLLKEYEERQLNALVTKLQEDKAITLLESFPDATYDPISGIFLLKLEDYNSTGDIAILAAGTSDLFVLNETYYTLRYLGVEAARIMDIGVSGLHRLLNRLDDIRAFKVLIVIAGFEGALPTVVGGLLPQPIIAVPTSIGYGVSADGQAALTTMLASCANGITVTNIDNGYGAAMAAFRILNQLRQ